MKTFEVLVKRTQIQYQTFMVKANSQADLEKKLDVIDFGHIDGRFDEGEVEMVDYEVTDTKPCKTLSSTFADDDLQECLNNL